MPIQMPHPHPKNQNSSFGFTLVELLVSIAIFSIVVSIAVGGFVQALRSEHQVAAMVSTESNLGNAFEEMAREIRTGYLFCHAPGADSPSKDVPCAPPGDLCTVIDDGVDDGATTETWSCPWLEFYNANGDKIDYELSSPGSGILERSDNGEYNGALEALTSSSTFITNLSFIIFGNLEGDHWNPRITIAVSARPTNSTVSWATANLETTVSARSIDCTIPNPPSSPSC